MRNTALLIGVLAIGSAMPCAAQTQPSEPPPHWHQTRISLGFNTYNGDSTSLSLSSRVDSTAVKDRRESVFDFQADFNKSGGRTIVDREWLDWALRERLVSHPNRFLLLHTWIEHNQTAGINFRGTIGPGFGAHIIDKPTGRVTLEGGVAITREEQVEDSTFPSVYFDPSVKWNFSQQTSLETYAEFRQDLKDTKDKRVYSESRFNVQITQRVGVYMGATIDFDNQPVRRHKKTTVQTYTMLSFSLGTGRR